MPTAPLGKMVLVLTTDAGKLQSGIKGAVVSVESGAKRLEKAGLALTAGVTAPIVGLGSAVVKTAGNFEASMIRVQAISQASAQQMGVLKDQTMALGEATIFSASQSAEGAEMLLKNGLKLDQVLGGALEATVDLAAATGTQMATGADIATDAMAAFNIKADEMTGAVNLITGATLNSKFGINDYKFALGQAGAVAGQMGASFLDFNATIAATSSAFASGSDAGTSYKNFLLRLNPATAEAAGLMEKYNLKFFDARGEMKSTAEIIQVLQQGLAGLSTEQRTATLQTIFGTDAIRTANALYATSSEEYERLKTSLSETSAQEQAAARMAGFNGEMLKLKGALEGLGIAIADAGLLEWATGLVQETSGLVKELSATNPELLKFGTVVAGVAAAAGPTLLVVKSMATGVAAVKTAMVATNPVVLALGVAWGSWKLGGLIAEMAGLTQELTVVKSTAQGLVEQHRELLLAQEMSISSSKGYAVVAELVRLSTQQGAKSLEEYIQQHKVAIGVIEAGGATAEKQFELVGKQLRREQERIEAVQAASQAQQEANAVSEATLAAQQAQAESTKEAAEAWKDFLGTVQEVSPEYQAALVEMEAAVQQLAGGHEKDLDAVQEVVEEFAQTWSMDVPDAMQLAEGALRKLADVSERETDKMLQDAEAAEGAFQSFLHTVDQGSPQYLADLQTMQDAAYAFAVGHEDNYEELRRQVLEFADTWSLEPVEAFRLAEQAVQGWGEAHAMELGFAGEQVEVYADRASTSLTVVKDQARELSDSFAEANDRLVGLNSSMEHFQGLSGTGGIAGIGSDFVASVGTSGLYVPTPFEQAKKELEAQIVMSGIPLTDTMSAFVGRVIDKMGYDYRLSPQELELLDDEGPGALPQYAKGFVVNRPTVVHGEMGERGPEALLPLDRFWDFVPGGRGGGGGGQTTIYNYYVTIQGSLLSLREAANQFEKVLLEERGSNMPRGF